MRGAPCFDLYAATSRREAVLLAWTLRARLRAGSIASCLLTGHRVVSIHARPWGAWEPSRGRRSALTYAVETSWRHVVRPDLPVMRHALDVARARRLAGWA